MSNLKKFYFCRNNQNRNLPVAINNLNLNEKPDIKFNGFKKMIFAGNKTCKSCGKK